MPRIQMRLIFGILDNFKENLESKNLDKGWFKTLHRLYIIEYAFKWHVGVEDCIARRLVIPSLLAQLV